MPYELSSNLRHAHAHVGDLVAFLCGKLCVGHRGIRWFLKSLSNLNVPLSHDALLLLPRVALRNSNRQYKSVVKSHMFRYK